MRRGRRAARVDELARRVLRAARSEDPGPLFDDGLTRHAASTLRRVRFDSALRAEVLSCLHLIHLGRWRAGRDAVDHDLALLYDRSRSVDRPLRVLSEAAVLRAGRHRPGARPRWRDWYPFTTYLASQGRLAARNGGVLDEAAARSVVRLAESLHDPHLRARVIAFARLVVPAPAPSPDDLAALNEGHEHVARFLRSGDSGDLDHAARVVRTFVDRLPDDDPAKWVGLAELALVHQLAHDHLFAVFQGRCGTENIDRAIAELRRARVLVEEATGPPAHVEFPAHVLAELGGCLLRRALTVRGPVAVRTDLAEARDLLERAVTLMAGLGDRPDPGRAARLNEYRLLLVQVRASLAVHAGAPDAIGPAVAEARRHLDGVRDPAERAPWQRFVGTADGFGSLLTGPVGAVAGAGGARAGGDAPAPGLAALREATLAPLREWEGPQHRIAGARAGALFAMRAGRWSEAVEFLTAALRLARERPGSGVPDSARRAWLSQVRGLAADLVGCLLAGDEAARAVVAFEEHRAVLLSEVLGDRAVLGDLHRAAPELAGEYRAAGEALRRFEEGPDAGRPDHSARRAPLRERRDRIAARIRAVPGFEGFRLPPGHEELLAVSAEGPVVLVNVGTLRGDAVVLRDGEAEVVRLPGLAADRLDEATRTLRRALRGAEEAGAARDRRRYLGHQRAVGAVLELLWDTVAEPVWARVAAPAHAEAPADADEPPRLWWVPSGPLWFLPVHAATARGGPSMVELAVSSHAPTVRLLREARRRRPASRPRPLAVVLPETPGDVRPLRGADEEAAMLAASFPGTRRLRGAAATRAAVLDALPHHPWLHFAGHGVNTGDGTSLLLHDWRENDLTERDVLGLDLPDAQLAYLSACETARTSPIHPDEATHFGAAFAVAGFRDVVGTLWRVDDRVAPHAARAFYGALRSGAPDPAHALHHTVRELRAAYPNMPGHWAAHVHIGP